MRRTKATESRSKSWTQTMLDKHVPTAVLAVALKGKAGS